MKRTINTLLAASIALAITGCSEEKAPIGNGVSANTTMEADYVILTPKSIANEINVTGTLMASESAQLSSQTAGLVKEIHFKEGQWVSKGQVLVQLDDRQWEAQRQKLEAQLTTARKELERNQQLLAIQGISQAAVDDAELAVASIEADIRELDVRIDFAVIRAPFSGRIGLRDVSLGAYVSAGDPVVRLVQVNPLKLEFSVPERYAGQVQPGQNVRFTTAGSESVYEARVYATESAISETTRALTIRANVPNPKGELIAGAFAEVGLTLDSIPDALLVPTDAVIPQLNEQIVYRMHDGAIHQVSVESGIRLARQLQIETGLQAGDTIMVSGLLQAKDGLAVNPGNEILIESSEN